MKTGFLVNTMLAAWAGMVGSALFVTVFTLEGWLRPGYNPLSTFVSALSLGSRGWIQIANFILFGLCVFLFSRGVASEFRTGKASKAGPILLLVISLLYFISGPFVMDPMGTPSLEGSWHGIIHGLAGGIVFILMPVCMFVFLRRFRIDPRWSFLYWWTLVLVVISTAAVLLLTYASKVSAEATPFTPWMGLIQRFLIIPFMVWVFIFALGLLRRTNKVS
jgi:hypothetical protein